MRSSFVDRVKYCAMQIKQIAAALENFAPLPLQEGYDNAGLQCGLTASECSGALLCLDVTEAVVQEAVDRGYNLIVAHHPLLFRGLKRVSDSTYVERTLRKAIQNDVAIYAAHTNLDNAKGGVNYEIAQHLGLQDLEFLEPIARGEQSAGSGLVGNLPQPMEAMDFLRWLKQEFKVENVHFSRGPQTQVQRIAFCGGAGDFLIDCARTLSERTLHHRPSPAHPQGAISHAPHSDDHHRHQSYTISIGFAQAALFKTKQTFHHNGNKERQHFCRYVCRTEVEKPLLTSD